MKNYLLLVAIVLFSQISSGSPSSFDGWLGQWKGVCKLTPPYNGVSRFNVSLKISRSEKADRFQWLWIYEAATNFQEEVRDYEMVAVDASKGYYVVDEHNGLLLDSFLDGNFLYSPFRINGKLITATYILSGKNEMLMDMPSFDATPMRKTCVTGYPNLCAESFRLRMSQRCTLKKVK